LSFKNTRTQVFYAIKFGLNHR